LIQRQENENECQFLWRLGQAKDKGILDMSWQEIADVMNKEFRDDVSEYLSEAAYRKPYQQANRFWNAGAFSKLSEDEYISELREAKHEIRKEKQKLFDERTALNKTLREQGRLESTFDVVKRAIQEYQPAKFNYEYHKDEKSDNDLVIHLTDIHCGVEIESRFNSFNFEILKERLKKYITEILNIKYLYKSENAYVILGGDLIQGLIHVNSRIESKENIVEQIMKVTDLISNFLYNLSQHFNIVEVHTTAGNHSRSTASKEDSVRGENFDLLIPFAAKKELQNITNIHFKNKYL